jgi:hypothetical protein
VYHFLCLQFGIVFAVSAVGRGVTASSSSVCCGADDSWPWVAYKPAFLSSVSSGCAWQHTQHHRQHTAPPEHTSHHTQQRLAVLACLFCVCACFFLCATILHPACMSKLIQFAMHTCCTA